MFETLAILIPGVYSTRYSLFEPYSTVQARSSCELVLAYEPDAHHYPVVRRLHPIPQTISSPCSCSGAETESDRNFNFLRSAYQVRLFSPQPR